ncbi:hypothetical protein FACS1894174_08740 [Bacteroidia bacterium]|nr:hypothetical protein FACS1894174_08740 [Bacteroidia bacterium]
MVSANIQIISDLREFMEKVLTNQETRAKYIRSPKDFTRQRDLPFSMVVLMIMNLMKRSLSIEIQSFFSHLGIVSRVTKSAFCLQRRKLKAQFFEAWNKELVTSYYIHYREKAKRWKGFILLAIDGTTLSLPDTEELRILYGSSANQYGSQSVTARSSLLYDVLNGLILSGSLDHFTEPERSVAIRLLENIPEESLITFDRGYPGFSLLYLLIHRQQCKFVMRVRRDFNKQIQNFAASKERDSPVEWYATTKGIKRLKEEGVTIDRQASVKVRLVKFTLKNGEEEILLTNLYDTAQYSLSDLREVYSLRWGIETLYGFAKNELQIESFSGIKSLCIQQDFYANLFVYNLQSLIEKQCEKYVETVSEKRIYRYKINKNISWAMLKNRMVDLFLSRRHPADILMELQALFEYNVEPVRTGRKYPRIKKVRKMHGKYLTLTNYKRAI